MTGPVTPRTPRTEAGRALFADFLRHRAGHPACRSGFTFKVSDCNCGLGDAILAIEDQSLPSVADLAAALHEWHHPGRWYADTREAMEREATAILAALRGQRP